jgi:hypothetical protein
MLRAEEYGNCRYECDADKGLIYGATVRFADSAALRLRRRAVVMWDEVSTGDAAHSPVVSHNHWASATLPFPHPSGPSYALPALPPSQAATHPPSTLWCSFVPLSLSHIPCRTSRAGCSSSKSQSPRRRRCC